jgi:S-adenosyl-L-methionine hydrolase (adenosine-forming)
MRDDEHFFSTCREEEVRSRAEGILIVLFTDFGLCGPYTGQMKAVLAREAPGTDIIDLFADAPAYDPQASAYLLAAYVGEFAPGTVFLCVVDPGVGSDRVPCVVDADGRWFVGPGNGLFELVVRRARNRVRCWRIDRAPSRLSATFHGRDVFAPVAAQLARGEPPTGEQLAIDAMRHSDWPDDLPRIIYIDVYGNAMSGMRADHLPASARVVVGGARVRRARTFSDVPAGEAFWYENANGLLEIAVNRGRASDLPNLSLGMPVAIEP